VFGGYFQHIAIYVNVALRQSERDILAMINYLGRAVDQSTVGRKTAAERRSN
jgi:hypothetical protein